MRHVSLESEGGFVSGRGLRLTSESLNHLRRVLRLEWNSEVRLTDGCGSLWKAYLREQGDGGEIVPDSLLYQDMKAPAPLELCLCFAKNQTMDELVEKATEAGVSKITVIVSAHSVVAPKKDEFEKYLRRWSKIIHGAMEQSERVWGVELQGPLSWSEFKKETSLAAFVTESRELGSSGAKAYAETVSSLQAVFKKSGKLGLLIGPEGGFSSEELADLKRQEVPFLSLGSQVQRVGTAAITALALARLSQS